MTFVSKEWKTGGYCPGCLNNIENCNCLKNIIIDMSKSKEFKFEDHFKPLSNGVIFEEINEMRVGDTTDSGIVIAKGSGTSTPEADVEKGLGGDNLGVRVVAVGPDVKRVKVGDVVMLKPGVRVSGMDIFNNTYFYTDDYTVLAILSEEADSLNKEMKETATKLAAEVHAEKRRLYLGLGDNVTSNIDIN